MPQVPEPLDAALDLPDLSPRVVAIGWATVEADRAATELAPLLAPGDRFEIAADSETLGARCRVARAGQAHGGLLIVLLEPATEGRVAGFLARSGEGWAATWLDAASIAGALPASTTHPEHPARPGPLGPESTLAGSPATGPFRMMVERATIGP